jgi:hypothetical protein
MRTIRILLISAVLFGKVCLASTDTQEKKLGATFDLTYMSRYLSKGTEPYGKQGGLFETIDLDLWGTGFGVAVGHQTATNSGYVDKQRFNYEVYYGSSLFNGEAYKTIYKIDWTYKNYYGRAKNIGNTQEWIFDFSWPDILPVKNLVPYYGANYEYPAGRNYNNANITGWMHRFGLYYKLSVPQLSDPLKLSAEVAYTDGLGGPTKDHDWSHATFGVSTKFKITDNLSFVPGMYHQISMDDSVNTHDVTYCKISMKYKF